MDEQENKGMKEISPKSFLVMAGSCPLVGHLGKLAVGMPWFDYYYEIHWSIK